MYCTRCGTKIDDDSVFCCACGNRIEQSVKESYSEFIGDNADSSRSSHSGLVDRIIRKADLFGYMSERKRTAVLWILTFLAAAFGIVFRHGMGTAALLICALMTAPIPKIKDALSDVLDSVPVLKLLPILFALIGLLSTGDDTPAPDTQNGSESIQSSAAVYSETLENDRILSQSNTRNTLSDTVSSDGKLEIYFLDVGEADAAVVLCGGQTMIIDGGTPKASSLIYSFLSEHNINRLDYMICTHPDSDHIGGLAGALNYAEVGTVYCPVESQADSKAFSNLLKYLSKQKKKITVPDAGERFMLGDASVTVLAPEHGQSLSDNTSIVLQIRYGNTSFLFTGDSEEADERAILNGGAELESTVLKVAHHGSSSSTCEEFLQKVKPEYAVISVGGDNSYGHPTEEVLERLKKCDTVLYRTDVNGMIYCVSDGNTVSFSPEKNPDSDTYTAPGGYENMLRALDSSVEAEAEKAKKQNFGQSDGDPENEYKTDYVLNTNSGKFHYPSCRDAMKIKQSNRSDVYSSHEELIRQGYSPCGHCNP